MMLHFKYLAPLMKFRTKAPCRAQLNSVVAARVNKSDHVTLVNHRLVPLPMSFMKMPGFLLCMTYVTRSQPLTSASPAAKTSQNIIIDPHPKEMEEEKTKFETGHEGKKIKGRVVLMKKNVLDLNDFKASVLDRVHELLGKAVSLRLISSVKGDPGENAICLLFYF
ncbi:putative linoleate 9S-lipoxygenase 5 isoform X2 [Prunus yedoensis var. nudiflora]|uniref:Putative linoleate 9S-lipoxygenase 5 isoform X2 n=1 Tax=Prunus yedoensis var. nudiflora TaxID=2094558 RepID=A0A314YM09_PRUYE|nr:putative linoleate 9S-lipoxygenase 5 isoform X2 [Prunus yedoensis var. nudiflora]